MESEEENNQIFRQQKKQKSVRIADDRADIVDIKEKHGPLYKSIPKLPIGAAVACCILNIVVPGFGKSLSCYQNFFYIIILLFQILPDEFKLISETVPFEITMFIYAKFKLILMYLISVGVLARLSVHFRIHNFQKI